MTIPGLLALFLCVFWPVSVWYVERLLDKSDEPLGVVSLIAFIAIALTRRRKGAFAERFAVPTSAIVFLVAYIISWPLAPKLLSAIFAVCAIGSMMRALIGERRVDLGGWLLLLFSLPVVSSLNFYSGYPLRLVVGKLAAPLISMAGFPTVADGCALIWGQQIVQIDAPCSGIKMLWFALFVGAVLASVLELSILDSAVVLGAAVFASLFGNVLRITSLFFVETGILRIDPGLDNFVHQAVGTVAFAIAAGLTVVLALCLSKKEAPQPLGGETFPAPISQLEKLSLRQRLLKDKRLLTFVISALIAALTPVLLPRSENQSISTAAFPGWPAQYEGMPYQIVPPGKADAAFYQEFPGKIQCVTQTGKRIIMRWVAKPTRQLHPSSDCFRGLGYHVTWKPIVRDARGLAWSCFTAEKDGRPVRVIERIYDSSGQSWTDISSWYWAALLGKTRGPWWSDVEISSL